MGLGISLWVNKMSKLGLKIFVIFIIVALGGLILTSFFIDYRFDVYFENYLRNIRRNKVENLRTLIEESYSNLENFSEAPQIVGNFASLNDFRVILRDNNGEIITLSTPNMYGRMNQNMMGRNFTQESNTMQLDFKNYDSINLYNSDKKIGELFWQRSRAEEIFSNTEDVFMKQINRAIFFAALIIALFVIFVTYFFSKYLTGNLNKMNKVVKEVANGNLDHEIEIKGNDEVAELGDSFNLMVNKLKHLERIRNESASDLAHELRTPLSNIKNYLEAIEDDVIKWNQKTTKELNEELNRLIKLVNKLNDLNEAEAKILKINREHFNLIKEINKIINSFEMKANQKNLKFDLDYNKDVEIYADKSSVQQVLNNIISNAVKYSYENTVIRINFRQDEDNQFISITNSGPEIKEKDLPYLFERFYRVDKARTQKDGSLGIGLTITRNLVEAHGGKIEVESDGHSTTFSIYFPQ